jgi:hypothetical protein
MAAISIGETFAPTHVLYANGRMAEGDFCSLFPKQESIELLSLSGGGC